MKKKKKNRFISLSIKLEKRRTIKAVIKWGKEITPSTILIFIILVIVFAPILQFLDANNTNVKSVPSDDSSVSSIISDEDNVTTLDVSPEINICVDK